MKNLILCIVLVLVSVANACAYDFIEGGIAYNILPNGTLSVTHKWEPRPINHPIDANSFVFYDFTGNVLLYSGTVKIPSTVKHKGKEYKVTEIGYQAFEECENLNSLSLPEGLRRIEYRSVVLTKIKSLNIPSTVTEIVPGAVLHCNHLAVLTVSSDNPKYISKGNCIYTKNMKELIMVSPTLKTYQFPSMVTGVADFAFDCSTITSLEIPNTLEYIGGKAFVHTYIGSIVCNKILKQLPDSDNLFEENPLPLWAIGKGEFNPDKKEKKEQPIVYLNCIYFKRVRESRMKYSR